MTEILKEQHIDALRKLSEDSNLSRPLRQAAEYAVDVLSGEPSETEFMRGHVVKDGSNYYMLLSYAPDAKFWCALNSSGAAVWVSGEEIIDTDMHLDLNVVTVNGVWRFLKNLEDKADEGKI